MQRSVTKLVAWASAVAGLMLLGGCEIGTEAPPVGAAAASTTGGRVARGNLKFVEGYSSGLAVAKSQSKPALVFFTAQWCHFCHREGQPPLGQPDLEPIVNQQPQPGTQQHAVPEAGMPEVIRVHFDFLFTGFVCCHENLARSREVIGVSALYETPSG